MENKSPFHFTNVEDYFDKIDVYSKVVRSNYMFHREFFSELNLFILENFGNNPIEMIDLGCGNAFHMSQILKDKKIISYTGFDLGQESLNEAQQNMENLTFKKDFICGDLKETFFNKNIRKCDLIWSSFCLHHFDLKHKKIFFSSVLNNLKEDSYFILVDFTNDFNSRDLTLTDWKKDVESRWSTLTKEEIGYVFDHVENYDFPESVETYFNFSIECGFKSQRKVLKHKNYTMMIFKS